MKNNMIEIEELISAAWIKGIKPYQEAKNNVIDESSIAFKKSISKQIEENII